MKTDINDTISEIWAEIHKASNYHSDHDWGKVMICHFKIRNLLKPHVEQWVSDDIHGLRMTLDEYYERK